jgi:prepilin-type processing-associated H-X9-DG protein
MARRAGIILLLFEAVWLNVILPGHTRGAVAFSGGEPGDGGGSWYVACGRCETTKTGSRSGAIESVVADGVFAGRQSVDGRAMTNSLIGYRHRAPGGGDHFAANAGFADGHAELLSSDQFPCAYATTASYAANGGQTTFARERDKNLTGPTVYPDPDGALRLFLTANPGAN